MRKQNGFAHYILLFVFTVLLAIIILFAFRRVDNPTKTKSPASVHQESQKKLVGFSLSPKDNLPANFPDFFSHLSKSNAAVGWYGDWLDLEKSGGGSKVVASLAKQYNYTPIIAVSAFKGGANVSQMIAIRPITADISKEYTDDAVSFCKKYSSTYFGIGTEVNRIYTSSSQDFNEFLSLFNQTADAIHSACPATKVFTTFQLEYLRGLRGGLYGGVNNESVNDWQLLDSFSKADLLAFSTYPGIIYKDPSNIPADYYSSIKSHTSKPIAFTEVGWPSILNAAGWESSQDEQFRYVNLFVNQTKPLEPVFSIWSFMYDLDLPQPFTGIGLLNQDGSVRPSYSAWVNQ